MDGYRPPYSLTDRCFRLISSISEKIGRLDVTNMDTRPHLRKISRIRSVYSSLQIEANSLPFDAVWAILNGKEVLGPPDEIREVENAFRAYDMVDRFDPWSLDGVKDMHTILTEGLCRDAGCFRKGREGVFSGDVCIYMAPEPDAVPVLMASLLGWMNMEKETVHPAIIACIAHYELVFIHPFSDGNGRLARLWQMALLSSWNPLFRYIPIENNVHKCQQKYYDVIDRCNHSDSITEFIEFMLDMIDQSLIDIEVLASHHSGSTACVKHLLDVMEYKTAYSSAELMELLGLKSRDTLRNHYIHPALSDGLIQMTRPEAPSSKNQMYIRS